MIDHQAMDDKRRQISLVRGDITQHSADVIVNAANSSMLGGGGVDGAIHKAGGPKILEECRKLRRDRYPDGLPVGDAAATTAGDLPARWVIHTVGPRYGIDDPAPELLAKCHTSALAVADELGARSIAFPAISTGVYRYPVNEAANIAVKAVRNAETSVEEITFVLFNDDAYREFERALA
jgi:O-acetyl-ADP-ribose deacetylase (regulator of RNase III)